MNKSNSHTIFSSCSEMRSKKNTPEKHKVAEAQNKYNWTANVSFISYTPDQRERAYRVWARLFLKSIKNNKNSD